MDNWTVPAHRIRNCCVIKSKIFVLWHRCSPPSSTSSNEKRTLVLAQDALRAAFHVSVCITTEKNLEAGWGRQSLFRESFFFLQQYFGSQSKHLIAAPSKLWQMPSKKNWTEFTHWRPRRTRSPTLNVLTIASIWGTVKSTVLLRSREQLLFVRFQHFLLLH